MTRTFIALEMNEALQRHLGEIIAQMAQALPRLRWVDPASIHLTLAFLGELDDQRLDAAIEATEQAAGQMSPFRYRATQAGTFGSPRQPRVIWVGIDEPTGKLARLHRLLNRELEQRGFELETRAFSPHLTLAHIKRPLQAAELQILQRMLTEKAIISPSSYFQVRHVNVMKSELLRSGARYTSLRDCPLTQQG
jgi:2'-5' RNA ligase